MENKTTEQKPNIAFVGEGEPLKGVNTASGRIDLPREQTKPFYHPDAALVIRTFPALYKPIAEKGAK
jgi:hypothetical protein